MLRENEGKAVDPRVDSPDGAGSASDDRATTGLSYPRAATMLSRTDAAEDNGLKRLA